MKFIYTIITILFITSIYSQQNMDTIYGNPKSVREKVEFLNKKKQNYKFMTDNDYGHAMIFTPKGVKETFHLYWYNYHWVFYVNYYKEFLKSGKAKQETWYNKDDSFKRKYEYSYDENQNIIEEKEIWYNNDFWLYRNYYDKDNNRIASTRNYSDKINEFSHWYNKYDESGNLIKTVRFDEDEQKDTFIRVYDTNNNLIQLSRENFYVFKNLRKGSNVYTKDSVANKHMMRKYEYNEKGNITIVLYFNEETNKATRKIIYKYDSRDNLIYEGYARDTVYAFRKYKYDSDNKKVNYEYSVVNNDSSKELVNYEYDENGFIIKVLCHFRKKEYTIDFKYKFDKKGNWTKITKIVNGEPLYVWTRKIKYYKD